MGIELLQKQYGCNEDGSSAIGGSSRSLAMTPKGVLQNLLLLPPRAFGNINQDVRRLDVQVDDVGPAQLRHGASSDMMI